MKLSIELVPSTCWYSNVRSNVRPETWDRLQHAAFLQAGHACEICAGTGDAHLVEAHEIWAYDDHRTIQRLVRLASLCPQCHEVKHIGLAIKSGHAKRALAWLANVNGISPAEALSYVERAFKIHEIRSRFQWKLDISLLTQRYGIKLDKHGIEQGFNLPICPGNSSAPD